MIKVGVNENIVISKTEKNDKGTLVIGVREIGVEVKEKVVKSLAEQMADGEDTTGAENSGETTFLIFPPKLVKYDKDDNGNDVVEDGKVVFASFIDMKNQLAHFLKRFTTSNNIKFSAFAGVALNPADEADILAKIVLPANAEKIYANFADQFIAQIKPFLNLETKPGRLFLHRQSEKSHFGTLRKKFLENQPFFEDMAIPVVQSKMFTKQVAGKTTGFHDAIEIDGIKYVPNFSDYELKKKLDDPNKIDAVPDTSSENAEQEIQNVDTLFSADAAGSADGGFVLEE